MSPELPALQWWAVKWWIFSFGWTIPLVPDWQLRTSCLSLHRSLSLPPLPSPSVFLSSPHRCSFSSVFTPCAFFFFFFFWLCLFLPHQLSHLTLPPLHHLLSLVHSCQKWQWIVSHWPGQNSGWEGHLFKAGCWRLVSSCSEAFEEADWQIDERQRGPDSSLLTDSLHWFWMF